MFCFLEMVLEECYGIIGFTVPERHCADGGSCCLRVSWTLMACLEIGALATDVEAWGKGVKEKDKQSKHVRHWLKDPADSA